MFVPVVVHQESAATFAVGSQHLSKTSFAPSITSCFTQPTCSVQLRVISGCILSPARCLHLTLTSLQGLSCRQDGTGLCLASGPGASMVLYRPVVTVLHA